MAVSLCSSGDQGSHFAVPQHRPAPTLLDQLIDEESGAAGGAKVEAATRELSASQGADGKDLGPIFDRQISATPASRTTPTRRGESDGRLVGCGFVGPTCRDALDAPRLEFEEFRRKANELAQEFFCAQDCEGMLASIRALGCASFHDELAALLLRASMDRSGPERQAVISLLSLLGTEGLLTGPQIARGFEKLVLGWDDLQLDVPDAPGQLVALLSEKVGLLDRHLFARLPEGLLRHLLESLPAGTPPSGGGAPGSITQARKALSEHLSELMSFKEDLERRVEADIFAAKSPELFSTWLNDVSKPAFHHEVVLAVCLGSMKPKGGLMFDTPEDILERQRMALTLLAHLSGSEGGCLITEVDMQLGFSRMLGTLSSHPSKAESFSKLYQERIIATLRGAVEQELLPAEFLKSARRMRYGGPSGVEALRVAQRQTPMHSRRVWGSGDERHFRTEVREAILEFFDSGSAQELGRIVEELHLTELEQSRFMRKLMVTGMERGEAGTALDAVSALLGRCWTLEEVRGAFEQLRDVAQDLVLDFPMCNERTTELVAAAVERGLLDKADLLLDGATIV